MTEKHRQPTWSSFECSNTECQGFSKTKIQSESMRNKVPSEVEDLFGMLFKKGR